MDDIAKLLNMDPLEIRLMNVFHEGSISPTGQKLQSVVVKESLLRAAEKFGWNGKGSGSASGKLLPKEIIDGTTVRV
jgi:CO/xanthine dehydrogenase Mo-binding subunit